LLQLGLADPFEPPKSKVLSWIGRAKPESELITAQVIADEYSAVADWLGYVSRCGTCSQAKCKNASSGTCPEEEMLSEARIEDADPGGCAPSTLELVFRKTVYDNRGRCSPCHFDDYEDPETPSWITVSQTCALGAASTLHAVEKRGLVNFDDPALSLLLQKPLDSTEVAHGGGKKFADESDDTYVAFRYFIERYVACYRAQ
jgi:hypothetical protein